MDLPGMDLPGMDLPGNPAGGIGAAADPGALALSLCSP